MTQATQTDDIPFPSSSTTSTEQKPYKSIYDVSFKKIGGDGKSHWIKIGIAFADEKGRISVSIDSVPLNWDGKLTLFERKPQ